MKLSVISILLNAIVMYIYDLSLKDKNGQTRNLTGKHDMSYVVTFVPYENNNIILHGYFETLARMDVTQAQKSINTMIYL